MKKDRVFYCVFTMLMFCVFCGDDNSSEPTPKLGHINGTVTDNVSGEMIYNASVSLNPTGKTQITGSDGMYEFIDLEGGQYTITVQKDGYRTNRKTVTVVPGQYANGNIPLTVE